MKTTYLNLLVFVVVAYLGVSPAGARPIIERQFGAEKVLINTPPGFRLANKVTSTMYEFTPEGQTVTNWRRLFSVVIAPGHSNSLQKVKESQKRSFLKDCGKTSQIVQRNYAEVKVNGQAVLEWVVGCSHIVAGASIGKAEVNVLRLIAGKEVELGLTLSFRYMPSSSEITAARRLLKEAGAITSRK